MSKIKTLSKINQKMIKKMTMKKKKKLLIKMK